MHHPRRRPPQSKWCTVLHKCKELEDDRALFSTRIDLKQVEVIVDEDCSDGYVATEQKFRFLSGALPSSRDCTRDM